MVSTDPDLIQKKISLWSFPFLCATEKKNWDIRSGEVSPKFLLYLFQALLPHIGRQLTRYKSNNPFQKSLGHRETTA